MRLLCLSLSRPQTLAQPAVHSTAKLEINVLEDKAMIRQTLSTELITAG